MSNFTLLDWKIVPYCEDVDDNDRVNGHKCTTDGVCVYCNEKVPSYCEYCDAEICQCDAINDAVDEDALQVAGAY